jgi:hypothetical protein
MWSDKNQRLNAFPPSLVEMNMYLLKTNEKLYFREGTSLLFCRSPRTYTAISYLYFRSEVTHQVSAAVLMLSLESEMKRMKHRSSRQLKSLETSLIEIYSINLFLLYSSRIRACTENAMYNVLLETEIHRLNSEPVFVNV